MTRLNFNSVGPDDVRNDGDDQIAELPASEDRQARSDAEAREREAKYAAKEAARAKQDDDFRAMQIDISFRIEGPGCEGGDITSGSDPDLWEFVGDETENAALVAAVLQEIRAALAPWLKHYAELGFVGEDQEGGPSFFFVYRPEDEALAPAELIAISDIRVPLASRPGATLIIQTSVEPINATLLFNAELDAGENEWPWGAATTRDRFRAADESRGDWLARVAVPGQAIGRALVRWKRSGGSLTAFAFCGASGERAVGDKPIKYLLKGVLARGYTTLLLGPQQVGKTTLLGEIAAVIDSQCQTRRTLLGIDVEARGVSCIVSGEDGDDVINHRNAAYSKVHGDALSYVIDLNCKPWAQALALLWDLPQLDFLALDPLRMLLEGDEDSSDRVSELFKQLEQLARAKDCAILLAHHLGKKPPNSLSALLTASRGSSVITQRPRAILGMLGRGAGVAEMGIIKWNLPREDMWAPINVGTLFRQECNTLVPIETTSHQRGNDGQGCDGTNDLILNAVAYHNARNIVLRRTGKSELFEAKMPQLAGLSRQAIRDGVSALVAAGRVLDGPEGLQANGFKNLDAESA